MATRIVRSFDSTPPSGRKPVSWLSFLSSLALLLLLNSNFLAQTTTRVWQMTGPFGGDVSSLALDPRNNNHLVIGTHDGQIFNSNDGGATWRRVSPGLKLNGFEIKRLLFDRERKGVIYAGLLQIRDAGDEFSGGTFFRSQDNGESWQEIEVLRGRSVRNIAQSASDPNVIVVAARDGIYRTRDRCESWERITPESDTELTGFHSVAIDPRDANSIYVGTWHLPWKTVDGGLTWKRAGSKETGMIDDSDIFCIQIDDSNPDTVFMSACSGIYRSTDASTKWTKLQGIPYASRRTHVIYQHPTRPEVIFAGTTEGLWRTTDNGKNWNLMSSKKLIVNAIAIHPEKPDRVFVGTEDMGVLVSNDGGENYLTSNAGFISRQIRVVIADRVRKGRLYAGVIFDGAGGGIYTSDDGGINWQQSNKGMGVRDVYSLYQDAARPEIIYAGTNYGLFRSDDSGQTWNPVIRSTGTTVPKRTAERLENSTEPSGTGVIQTLSTARITGKRIKPVVQTKLQSRDLPATVTEEKVMTGSAGQSSNPSASILFDLRSQVFALATGFPSSDRESRGLFAATWEGLYKTIDEKKGWEPVFLPSTKGRTARIITRAVATTPHAPLVLAGTEEGLFISRDNGLSFSSVLLDGETRRIQTIAIDPRNAETIYVGTSNAFFRSIDGGRTWERRGGGLKLVSSVSAITINPSNPDEVFVGDYNQGGLYRSVDRGKNWEMLNINDLPSTRLWSIATDPFNTNKLIAGSFSGGVYLMTKE